MIAVLPYIHCQEYHTHNPAFGPFNGLRNINHGLLGCMLCLATYNLANWSPIGERRLSYHILRVL